MVASVKSRQKRNVILSQAQDVCANDKINHSHMGPLWSSCIFKTLMHNFVSVYYKKNSRHLGQFLLYYKLPNGHFLWTFSLGRKTSGVLEIEKSKCPRPLIHRGVDTVGSFLERVSKSSYTHELKHTPLEGAFNFE